ncbi:MAG TPA: FAD-binding oxidoreductase [Woeseiaceae bacterium]|nr:FAD-binding oxidoreductase [Woeseiaceae bacterium]
MKYAIVGAGIVGTHCALQIRAQQPDAEIIIVDRSPYSYSGASSGNMGGFATCEVQPLATPANLLRGIGWMLNPLAPFTLRPKSIPELRPWLARFIRSALTPGHATQVIRAQQALMDRATEAHFDALGGSELANLISDEGALFVYKSARRMRRDWNQRWRLFRERGEICEQLSALELHERLPGLSSAIEHGIYVPAIRQWKSPASLLAGLHRMLHDRDITVRTASVQGVVRRGGLAQRVVLEGGEELEFDCLTVAAGAWSAALCASVGDVVPLASERGYSTTLQHPNVSIANLLLFPDDEFVAAPMAEGLRLGGTVELARLGDPPNFKRTDLLAKTMRSYFPDIDTSVRDEWMGHRPSVPDGLPVIGRSPTCGNVCYAFGHGHVGVTQSAITGRLVAQLWSGQTTDIDLKPYSISRFSQA